MWVEEGLGAGPAESLVSAEGMLGFPGNALKSITDATPSGNLLTGMLPG